MCHSRPAQRCWLRLPAPGGSRTDRAGGIPGRPARLGSARGRSMSDRTGLITLRGRPSRRRPQPDGGAAQWPRRQPAASSGGRCRRARRLLRRPRTRTKAAAGGSDRPAADNPHRPRGAPPTSSSSSGSSSSSRTAVHCQLLRPCGRWLQFTAADRCRTLGAVPPRPQRSRRAGLAVRRIPDWLFTAGNQFWPARHRCAAAGQSRRTSRLHGNGARRLARNPDRPAARPPQLSAAAGKTAHRRVGH